MDGGAGGTACAARLSGRCATRDRLRNADDDRAAASAGRVAGAFRLPLETIRRIAKHELSHARWRDPLVYATLRVVAAVFWMSPLWLLLAWTRREREAAADEYALRDATGGEESYVSALLRMSCGERRHEIGMAGSDLAYRARRILVRERASWLAVVVLIAGCALVMVARPIDFDSIPDTDRVVHVHRDVQVHIHR